MQLIDELFMVLYRLRCDALEKDMADQFGVSVSSVSRTLNTWIKFLYHTLKQLPIWPSSKVVKDTMPVCFKDQYPDTRVILDLYGAIHRNAIFISCLVADILVL